MYQLAVIYDFRRPLLLTITIYFDSLPLKVHLINITPYGRKTLLRRVSFILPLI